MTFMTFQLKKKNLFRLRQCMQTKHGINFRYSGVFSTLHWDLEAWGALNLSEILTLKMTDEKKQSYPPNIYLFKVSYRNTKKKGEMCLKLSTKTSERRMSRCLYCRL